jgi:hypothetical protein
MEVVAVVVHESIERNNINIYLYIYICMYIYKLYIHTYECAYIHIFIYAEDAVVEVVAVVVHESIKRNNKKKQCIYIYM